MTATFPWYKLKQEDLGPAGGLDFKPELESRNPKSVGPGIVPHITLKSIANNEPPDEEVLVDRPEVVPGITRVTGPFTLEGTIPAPIDWDGADKPQNEPGALATGETTFTDRMLEILRKSPVLRLEGNKTATLYNLRPPAKSLSLSAEALVPGVGAGSQESGKAANGGDPVAFVFGPENGAVSEKLVYEAAREAAAKNYTHLYAIGFAIQPNARAGGEVRRGRRHHRHLCASHPRSAHGRPFEEHALQPDLQRMRLAGG